MSINSPTSSLGLFHTLPVPVKPERDISQGSENQTYWTLQQPASEARPGVTDNFGRRIELVSLIDV